MVDNAISSWDFGRGAVQIRHSNSLLNSGMTPILQAVAEWALQWVRTQKKWAAGGYLAEQLTQKA